MSFCSCCSGLPFSKCCEPFLVGKELPASAEQLMRSRYSAFCLGDVNYLLETSSSALLLNLSTEDLSHTVSSCNFIKLEIIYADSNCVEFKADYLMQQTHEQIHEKSTFVQESGKWKYDSGQHFPTFSHVVKRNDICPCGSGKKFKKCHLN